MQDRYVGDVGDFAKYALLRQLCVATSQHQPLLGVIWCRYPDESHNHDGRHVAYFRRSEFANMDLELMSTLRTMVESSRRSIAAVANAGILPPGTIFCDAPICLPAHTPSTRENRLRHRSNWWATCFQLTELCELVFFDPDNGIETASVPKEATKAGKYVYWDELEPFWWRGQGLVIYHHLNRRKPTLEQVTEMSAQIRTRFGSALVKPLLFRRGSCRVFWLVGPRTSLGREMGRRADEFLNAGWAAHFQPIDQ